MRTLLEALRASTADLHERLDASFGSLDLRDAAAYRRFLEAHMAGLSPLHRGFAETVSDQLALTSPDYPAMLASDLADIGATDAASEPSIALDRAERLGTAYVIAGSRLGIAQIGRQDHWGKASRLASRYLEDTSGLAIWKALMPLLKSLPGDDENAEHACRAAVDSFTRFENAFLATAPANA